MDGGGGVDSDGGGSVGGSVESMIDVQLCPELNNFKRHCRATNSTSSVGEI